ncbi:uncharacterized protein cubi_03629 [Cryptosporidium ubiquitum]|uniref:Uncharacterized protein n=1 Tax=Cryptosporidium ubiquitum TaxID=857276 RepID=A0A1J4MHZ8_9CRYT|nr:uncharacterized protein cubi_03629 [Cryptosporidium ubiquitum]OII73832.1 hypothetical protein cubi_03629 [Cryptosporidium ubiquitum]
MNPHMDYQFAQNYNDGLLEYHGNYVGNDHYEHDQGEYYDINRGYYEEDEMVNHEINPNFANEEVSCCPMEMIHKKRHSLSYKPNIKKGVRKTDVSKIPKFRNPWDVKGDLQPKSSKDIPLSYDEARFIREIWQDTRAQYEPSDGEIEEEFLFEEEYDDLDAEKRRNRLVESGASLVRYSRHYELPTISTIIKSSNPEQFRSRSFSPVRSQVNGAFNSRFNRANRGSRTQIRGSTQRQYERGVREDFNFENDYRNQYLNDNKFDYRNGNSRMQYMNNAIGRKSVNQNGQFGGEMNELNFTNNGNNETNPNEIRENSSLTTPISSRYRNTVLGVPSEFDHLNDPNNHFLASAGSRRATSPDLLSPTKSTGRGPPPKIGILEPVETSEGLISPVNQRKKSVINTPRIGSLTSRSSACSILGVNRNNIGNSGNNSPENVPIISPSGKQTIVFHMLPDNESNNSKATIFADPDTQNIVTELHIKPGVDINVISTPTGPAIEYEISGGRNAKAHINFSTNTNSDSSISIGDIPKIQTPKEFQEEQFNFDYGTRSSNFKGHDHSYNDRSRSQSRRRSSLEENKTRTYSDNQGSNFTQNQNGMRTGNNNYNHFKQYNSHYPKSQVNQPTESDGKKDEINSLKTNSQILNSTIDEAGKIFSEIERDIQSQVREGVDQTGDVLEYSGYNQENSGDIESSADFKYIQSSKNESKLLEGDVNCNEVFQDNNHPNLNTSAGGNNNVHGITKSRPNPFLPIKKIQKRSGLSGCILNTLTCSKVESAEMKTFRALNPVEMINRNPEFY